MPTRTPPPRIYGLMARQAPVCVLFRRGPTKQVQVIRWDTKADEFQFGQWLKGRIYEDRCDLSPNGELMVYFGGDMRYLTESRGTWTAVSKPPYLTALAWFPQGDTWGGNGLFVSNDHLLINGSLKGRIEKGCPLKIEQLKPATRLDDNEMDRLYRHGWIRISNRELAAPSYTSYSDEIVEKIACGCILRYTHVQGQKPSFSAVNDAGLELRPLNADWAEVDQQGRIVFAREGKVYSLGVEEGVLQPERELIDLTDNTFEAVEAPDWAKKW
jgi:hypothetical protein